MSLANDLKKPPTYEDYAAWCRMDGEEMPTLAQYEAFLAGPIEGKIGVFAGIRFVEKDRS